MALQTEYTYGGYMLPAAYLKATIGRVDASSTVILYDIWPTQADRDDDKSCVYSDVKILPTDLDLIAANPLIYAYELLKTLPEYTDAIDV